MYGEELCLLYLLPCVLAIYEDSGLLSFIANVATDPTPSWLRKVFPKVPEELHPAPLAAAIAYFFLTTLPQAPTTLLLARLLHFISTKLTQLFFLPFLPRFLVD